MRFSLLVFLCLIIWIPPSLGQYHSSYELRPFSSSDFGISSLNPWSTISNPSLLSSLKKPWVGVSHINRYNLADLSSTSLLFTVPFKSYGFGFQYTYFGADYYHTHTIHISYGQALSSYFHLGGQFQIRKTASPPILVPAQWDITFRLGMIYAVSPSLRFAFSMTLNTFSFQTPLRSTNQGILSLTYAITPRTSVVLEIFKRLSSSVETHFAIRYIAHPKAQLSVGISPKFFRFHLATSIHLKKLWLTMNFSIQPPLGFITQSSFNIPL